MLSKLNCSIQWQKSRARWLKDGDANTKYFHWCINKRRKFNQILNLEVNERRLTRVVEIKDAIFQNFHNHFSARGVRLISANMNFNRIEGVHNYNMVREFTEKEVRSAVWDYDNSKSLSPDGVNFRFVKEFWEDIKHDFIGIMAKFQVNGQRGKQFIHCTNSQKEKCGENNRFQANNKLSVFTKCYQRYWQID